MNDEGLKPDPFSGIARLFPLPNLVMFPHALQALHVFEPRYRDMVRDALADDRFVTMVLLKPGWETDYPGRPPIHTTACLGRITTYHPFEDGRYNLLLTGLSRVRIVRELAPQRTYREAAAELCPDLNSNPHQAQSYRQDLIATVRSILPHHVQDHKQIQELIGSKLPLGPLVDIVSYAIDLDVRVKQQLLEEPDVECRLKVLLSELKAYGAADREGLRQKYAFPPEFSEN